jgi:hypothetical protein
MEILRREEEKRVKLEGLPPECGGARLLEIRQGFIREILDEGKPHCDVRVRRAQEKGEAAKYTMTAKFRPLKQESETEISREMFSALWPKTEKKQEKRRYLLECGWVVDEMADGSVVAEFEYGKGKSPEMPEGFKEAKQ